MTSTQVKIQDTIAEIKKLNSIEKHHSSTTTELENSYTELSKLEDQLVIELQDMEELEKMSITSVFYKVLGSQDEQLEKERQEYLTVSLKHKELKKDIEILEYEHKIISSKVQEIGGFEAILEQLKKQRLQEILNTDDHHRRQIMGIHREMDNIQGELAELNQANSAGDAALRAIDEVIKHLKDAEHWGNWDMMNNQSAYYSKMKHNAIDRAMNAAQQAKHKLKLFDRELIDVNIEQTQLHIKLDGFGRFIDIFFDNLISDWVIQRKIKNALNNVESTFDKTRRYVLVIEKEMSNMQRDINALQNNINEVLES